MIKISLWDLIKRVVQRKRHNQWNLTPLTFLLPALLIICSQVATAATSYPAVIGYSTASGQPGISPSKGAACLATDAYFYNPNGGL